MFKIDKYNRIKLTKGDNAEIDLRVFNKEGTEIQILPSDVITMAIKALGQIVLIKEADLNSIFFYPEDTSNLSPGVYSYEVEFVRDDERQTIIPESIFELLEELH